jgi:hypothetical protein
MLDKEILVNGVERFLFVEKKGIRDKSGVGGGKKN